MALEGCVICTTSILECMDVRNLVEGMGGEFNSTLSSHCTHVIATRTGSHRYHVARSFTPDVPIVHPQWLWTCYWYRRLVSHDSFEIDFMQAAAVHYLPNGP